MFRAMNPVLVACLLTIFLVNHHPVDAYKGDLHCRAQLKNADGKNAAKKGLDRDLQVKDLYKSFEKHWPPAYQGDNPGSIETDVVWVKNDCTARITVNVTTCTFDGSRFNQSLQSWNLQSSPRLRKSDINHTPLKGPPKSAVEWYGCSEGQYVHLDWNKNRIGSDEYYYYYSSSSGTYISGRRGY